MEAIKSCLVIIFLIGTFSLFAQTEKSIFSTIDSKTITIPIKLHLNKSFKSSFNILNYTNVSFSENRWTNVYRPSNSYLVKDETTGYWLNLKPSYFPINAYESLFIKDLIVGLFKN